MTGRMFNGEFFGLNQGDTKKEVLKKQVAKLKKQYPRLKTRITSYNFGTRRRKDKGFVLWTNFNPKKSNFNIDREREHQFRFVNKRVRTKRIGGRKVLSRR